MPKVLAYIDEPAPKDRHRDPVPAGTVFAQARVPAVDGDAETVIIGPPDAESKIAAHRHWAEVKRKYEQERDHPEGSVSRSCEIRVEDSFAPDLQGGEDALAEVVGTRQANALDEAGYGTVQAARALDKEDLVALDGVGEATYDKLHSD